jgi:hypothetical protein
MVADICRGARRNILGNHKVFVNLMITIHLATWPNLTAWQSTARARGTLTPSVIPNSNYVIMVVD